MRINLFGVFVLLPACYLLIHQTNGLPHDGMEDSWTETHLGTEHSSEDTLKGHGDQETYDTFATEQTGQTAPAIHLEAVKRLTDDRVKKTLDLVEARHADGADDLDSDDDIRDDKNDEPDTSTKILGKRTNTVHARRVPTLRKIQLNQVAKKKEEKADTKASPSFNGWCVKCLGVKGKKGKGGGQVAATADELEFMWTVVAIVAISMGVILTFFGEFMLYASMICIGAVVFFMPTFFVSCGIFGSISTDAWSAWIAFSIAVLMGLLGSVMFCMLETVGKACSAAAGGFIFALELNGWGLHYMYTGDNGMMMASAVTIGFAIMFALLVLCNCFGIQHQVIMASTSLVGGYFLLWGSIQLIDCFGGGSSSNSVAAHTNPMVLFFGEHWSSSDDWIVYLVLGGFLLFTFVGYEIQSRVTATESWEDHLTFLRPKDTGGRKASSDKSKPTGLPDSGKPINHEVL